MEKRVQNFISAILIIAGFVFLFPALNITGNVVGQGLSETAGKVVNSVLGLALVIAGLVAFLAGERAESKSTLVKKIRKIKKEIGEKKRSGAVLDYPELRRYARMLWREDEKGDHYVYYDSQGNYKSKIPMHKKGTKKGTSRGILTDLYKYVSSF